MSNQHDSDYEGGIPAAQNAEDPRKNGSDSTQGETRWSQVAVDGKQTPAPKQPNERDESASSQDAKNASMNDIGKLAHHDAETTLDTDRGPVLDAVYNNSVTEGHRTGDEEEINSKRSHGKSTSSELPDH